MRYDDQSIPDRSQPGLPTTASCVARQGTCGNYATAGLSENKRIKRRGRQVRRQRAGKERRTLVRVGTLSIEKMTGRGRELADMMKRRNVDTILCLQKTKWEGSKARNIKGSCTLFYNGTDGRNGIGIVVREKLVESVLEVKRVSNRLMAMKLNLKGSILNLVCAYVPQVSNSMKEKNDF